MGLFSFESHQSHFLLPAKKGSSRQVQRPKLRENIALDLVLARQNWQKTNEFAKSHQVSHDQKENIGKPFAVTILNHLKASTTKLPSTVGTFQASG